MQIQNITKEKEDKEIIRSLLESDINDLELEDVFDSQSFQSIINNFYNLTHIPLSITDNKGKILVGAGWQDICTQFHRSCPETNKHCIESDTQLTKDVLKGEFKLYKCKNNMWDISTPIIIAGKHLGNVFSGQFFFEDEQPDYEIFRKQARKYGFNEEKYIKALDAAPRLSRETINKGMVVLMEFADIISQMSYNNIKIAKSLSKSKKLAQTLKENEEKYRFLADNLEKQVHKRTAELQTEKNYLNTILSTTKSGIYIVDSNYELEYLNPMIEKDFGLYKGQKCYEYFYKKDGICSNCKIQQAFEGNTVEWEHKSSKSNKTYDVLATPITKKNSSILVFLYDVTRRDKAEIEREKLIEELKNSNQELQSFAYITSHDLQEPLRTIASFAQLLQRRYKGQLDEDADDFLDYMVSGATRMKSMVQGLLDYSRAGTGGYEFKEFSSEEALNTALSNLHSSIEECNAEVIHDLLPAILANKSQITRVFQNLIGNALKFRKEGIPPKIHISAQEKEGEYIFSVSDNGIGLEEQYSERIFEVFKRLHAIGEFEGAGIGLAIVKRIIDRHGGRVWVESTFGEGSTFYFTIPVMHEDVVGDE